MRRFTRKCLKTALVLAVIGIAFGLASLCMGFRPGDLSDAMEEGRFTFGSHNVVSIKAPSGSLRKVSCDETFAASEVTSLKLDVDTVPCTIIPEDTDKWSVTGSGLPSDFTCSVKDGLLKISCNDSVFNFFGNWNLGKDSAKLEIHAPEDQMLDTVKIETGVGEFTVKDGYLKCRHMKLDCGVGEVSVWADVSEKLEFDGGIGEFYLKLKGREDEFDFEIDHGIGDVEIGDTHHSGLGIDHESGHDAEKKIIIDHGIGEVTVEFSE